MAAMRNYIETVLSDSVTVLTDCAVTRLIWTMDEHGTNKRKEVKGLFYKKKVWRGRVSVSVGVCVFLRMRVLR